MTDHRTIGTLACIAALGISSMAPCDGEERDGPRQETEGEAAVVMRAMRETAGNLVLLRTQEYRAGVSGIEGVLAAQRKLHEVKLKLAPDAEGRRRVLAECLRSARETEEFAGARVKNGTASQTELLVARLARQQAELALLEEDG